MIELVAFVPLLLKLLEQVQKLKEYRDARKKRAFKELAEPVFTELLEVHKNYMSIFAEAESNARQGTELTKIIENLQAKRREFEPVRVKLRTLVRTLIGKTITTEMDIFLVAVAKYFPAGDIYSGQYTASTSLIEHLTKLLPKQSHRRDEPGDVEDFYWKLEDMLSETSEEERLTVRIRESAFGSPDSDRLPDSPAAIIGLYIKAVQLKWERVCQAFADVKKMDLNA
jgi:hypothetical protein